MDKVLVDTDILSDFLRGKNTSVRDRAQAYVADRQRLTLSVVTVFEIIRGRHHPGQLEHAVAASELTNCVRTELANVTVVVQDCLFRLMENNFVCAEGVVGQASTELLSGKGNTATVVGTKLFDQMYTGVRATPASIATQWGHTFASIHETTCTDPTPGVIGRFAQWNLDPFTKTAVLE
jgi:hypothetical protein